MYAAQYGAVAPELETMFSVVLSGLLRQGNMVPHIPVESKLLFSQNIPVRAVVGGRLCEMKPEHAYQLRGRMEELGKLAGLLVEPAEVVGLRASNVVELQKGMCRLGEALKRPDLVNGLLHKEDLYVAQSMFESFQKNRKEQGSGRA